MMLSNCDVRQQGDQACQSWGKSILDNHWKDWCWNWSSNTSATWWEKPTIRKDPDAGKDWGQEEKGATKDELVGWHPVVNGHEFEQTQGDSEDSEAWRAAVHGVAKSGTQLNDWRTTFLVWKQAMFLHSFVPLGSLIVETCSRTSIVATFRRQSGLDQKCLLISR